jgi:hypothetical protein
MESKVLLLSVHRELVYLYALAFVDRVEPSAQGGLATAYYDRQGRRLTTLEEVCRAAQNGDLAARDEPERLAA